MRAFQAFIYALLIYGLLTASMWALLRDFSAVSEESRSTVVTLVSPEESFEKATQAVNSEASRASPESPSPSEEPKSSEEPLREQEEFQPQDEPVSSETSEREKAAEEESKAVETQKRPESELSSDVTEMVAAAESAVESVPSPPPKAFKPADPIDPKLYRELKRPLTDSELLSCCPPEKKSVTKKHARKKTRRSSRSSRESAYSRARRGGRAQVNRLLATIKRRIARNKRYPASAKRRRIQGKVRVSFTVTRSGGVSGIRVQGPRIFAAASRSAVRQAFPVNVGGAAGGLPRRMSVVLHYRLR